MSRVSVVCVPGLGADKRLWQPVLDQLTDVVDPTVAACKGNSIAAWADEIFANAPDRFYIAGTSMGGYVALEVALRKDERVAGAILLNTNARSASPEQRQRSAALIEMARNGNYEQVVDRIASFVSGGKPDVMGPVATMARDAGPEIFARQQQAVLERQDRRAELSRINRPTLVIAGDDDRVTPPSLNNEIARAIPGAELEILASGHVPTLEIPSAVAGKIREWLLVQETAVRQQRS